MRLRTKSLYSLIDNEANNLSLLCSWVKKEKESERERESQNPLGNWVSVQDYDIIGLACVACRLSWVGFLSPQIILCLIVQSLEKALLCMCNSWDFNLSWKESPRRQNSSILDMESFGGTFLEPTFCEAPEIKIRIGLCGRKLEAIKAKWRNSVREKRWQGSSCLRQELTEVKAWPVDRKIPGPREEGLEQTWVEKQPFLFCSMRFAFPWNTPESFFFNQVSGMSFGGTRVT